jgi:hypothetical protein
LPGSPPRPSTTSSASGDRKCPVAQFISGVRPWRRAKYTTAATACASILSAGARCSATRRLQGRWGGAWRCRGSGGCTGGTRLGSSRCSGGARPAATLTPPTSSDW